MFYPACSVLSWRALSLSLPTHGPPASYAASRCFTNWRSTLSFMRKYSTRYSAPCETRAKDGGFGSTLRLEAGLGSALVLSPLFYSLLRRSLDNLPDPTHRLLPRRLHICGGFGLNCPRSTFFYCDGRRSNIPERRYRKSRSLAYDPPIRTLCRFRVFCRGGRDLFPTNWVHSARHARMGPAETSTDAWNLEKRGLMAE